MLRIICIMNLVYWLMLLRVPYVGVKTFYQALKVFETPEMVFKASEQQLRESGLFKTKSIESILAADKSIVDADIMWQKNDNCHIITIVDDEYPEGLKQISDPPPLLYVRGGLKYLSKPQLAIVGSRNPSASGKDTAQKFAFELAKKGLTITSGMATGIDAKAHIGTLEAGFPTIAVCGTGLDRIYPAKHKSLAHQISISGALISEFPIGTSPIAANFPRRNRIISALSMGVLVVESSIKSGTMITAKLAADQGKEVFAVPSAINNPLAEGPHLLIKQGAKLTENIDDILQELPASFSPVNNNVKEAKNTKSVDNNASVLLKYLGYNAVSIDQLVEKSGMSPQIVTQELLLLELDNRVEKTASGYVLIR